MSFTQAEYKEYRDLSVELRAGLEKISEQYATRDDFDLGATAFFQAAQESQYDGVAGITNGRKSQDLLNQRIDAYAEIINKSETKGLDNLSYSEKSAYDEAVKNFEIVQTKLPGMNPDKIVDVNNDKGAADLRAVNGALQTATAAIANGTPKGQAFGSAAAKIDPLSLDGAGQNRTVSDRAKQIRDAMQCWLLYNMQPFAEFRNDNMVVDPQKNVDLPGFRSSNLKPSAGLAGQRITMVSPLTPGFAVANKLNQRKGTKEFLSIQSHEYAQISPTLRIYKVQNDFLNGSKKMIEFDFSNATRLDGIARELTTHNPNGTSYNVFTRGSEVGIESFEWQFLGSDPFSATRDISATLKIHAQNLAVLFEKRTGSVTSSNQSATAGSTEVYRYIDLLVQPDCEYDYSPECFEVRVDVGYAPVDGATVEMRDSIKENVKEQKDTLFLVLVDHSFDVAEDGSITVTINFQGRLETLMKTRKANVLLPYGGLLQKALTLDVAGERFKYTPVQIEDEITKIKSKKKVLDVDKKRIKNFESALSDLSFQYKQIINSHILDTLYSKGLVHEYNAGLDGKDRANFDLFKEYTASLSRNQTLPPLIDKAQIKAQLNTLGGKDFQLGKQAPSQEEQDKINAALDNNLSNLNLTEQRKIRFFYFGDLIATVLQSVTGDNTVTGRVQTFSWFNSLWSGLPRVNLVTNKAAPDKKIQAIFNKFRIIMGNLDLDLGLNPAINTDNNKVNLANVPISVEAYAAWFRSSVLSSTTAEYAFFDFVDDVMSDLIMDPLSSQCFNGLFDIGFVPKTTTIVAPSISATEQPIDEKIYMTDVQSSTAFGGAPTSRRGPGLLNYNVLNIDLAIKSNEPVFKHFGADSSLITSLHEYLYIGSEITDLDVLKGDESEDEMMGIPHLHFGNIQGAMKKVTFQKSDIEYLPEVRYASEGNFLYNQLANVYDVSIELIGNNLFKPGQYVYIDTTALGAGPTWAWNDTTSPPDRSWANLMGLGGYHLVTEVAHSISRDGFSTVLKARFVSSGKRNYKLQNGRFIPAS